MTDENRRINIAAEMDRADQALRAAQALVGLAYIPMQFHGRTTHNRLLGSLQRARELADYDAAVSFAPEDVAGELDAANRFADHAREWLVQSGWWTPPSP